LYLLLQRFRDADDLLPYPGCLLKLPGDDLIQSYLLKMPCLHKLHWLYNRSPFRGSPVLSGWQVHGKAPKQVPVYSYNQDQVLQVWVTETQEFSLSQLETTGLQMNLRI